MAKYTGTVSFTVSIEVENVEHDDETTLAQSLSDSLDNGLASITFDEEVTGVTSDLRSNDLRQARGTYEVTVEFSRTQRVQTTVLVAASDEDEAREWAEMNLADVYEPDWDYDGDTEDQDMTVDDVTEYSDDEGDADYEA